MRACDGDSEGALCHTKYLSTNSHWCLGKRHLPNVRPWAGQCVLRTTSPPRCCSQLLRDHFWTEAGYSVLRVYVWGCRTGCGWNPRSVSPSTQAIQSKSPPYSPYLRKKWTSLYLLKTPELLICWLHASLAMHAQAFHLVFCPKRENLRGCVDQMPWNVRATQKTQSSGSRERAGVIPHGAHINSIARWLIHTHHVGTWHNTAKHHEDKGSSTEDQNDAGLVSPMFQLIKKTWIFIAESIENHHLTGQFI